MSVQGARASPTLSGSSQTSTHHKWNQIKFTSKLIPTFAGKENENIVSWLERITSIGRLYQIMDDVLVLVAVQLSGRTLDYNRQNSVVESVTTWEDLKF